MSAQSEEKLTLGHYLTIFSIALGLIGTTLGVIQYLENKEVRAMQAELTALQLEKAKKEKATGAA